MIDADLSPGAATVIVLAAPKHTEALKRLKGTWNKAREEDRGGGGGKISRWRINPHKSEVFSSQVQRLE